VLAHELNNGLAIIAGQCELLADQQRDSESAKGIRLILDVVHRLAAKINGHECRFAAGQSFTQDRAFNYIQETRESTQERSRS
jgi:nitrogen-specific signal transduction histidine kinase